MSISVLIIRAVPRKIPPKLPRSHRHDEHDYPHARLDEICIFDRAHAGRRNSCKVVPLPFCRRRADTRRIRLLSNTKLELAAYRPSSRDDSRGSISRAKYIFR